MYRSVFKLLVCSAFALAMGTAFGQPARPSPVTPKKIVVVVTNHAKYPGRSDKTGLWLTELTHFHAPLKRAGYDIDIVSPAGGPVPLDERSLGWLYMDQEARDYLKSAEFMAALNASKPAAGVDPSRYAAIYFAGGHGTMWDFRGNAQLKRIAEAIYQQGGVVSSVCHGAAALVDLQAEGGVPLIRGRTITGFSNAEETLSGLEGEVPYSLQDALQARGAQYEKSYIPFKSFVVTDGRIVTGQNPGSTKAVAAAVIQVLREGAQASGNEGKATVAEARQHP